MSQTGYSKILTIGTIARDIEINYTTEGTAYANLGIAITTPKSIKNTKDTETTFAEIQIFGNLAESTYQFAKKGVAIVAEGKLHQTYTEDLTTKEKKSVISIIASNIIPLDTPPPIGMSKVILVGNLTRDTQIRHSTSTANTAFGKISIAINTPENTKKGKKAEVSFIDVIILGNIAEILSKYGSKGRTLLIEGQLEEEKWTDKTTQQPKSRLVVKANEFRFLNSPRTEPTIPR